MLNIGKFSFFSVVLIEKEVRDCINLILIIIYVNLIIFSFYLFYRNNLYAKSIFLDYVTLKKKTKNIIVIHI